MLNSVKRARPGRLRIPRSVTFQRTTISVAPAGGESTTPGKTTVRGPGCSYFIPNIHRRSGAPDSRRLQAMLVLLPAQTLRSQRCFVQKRGISASPPFGVGFAIFQHDPRKILNHRGNRSRRCNPGEPTFGPQQTYRAVPVLLKPIAWQHRIPSRVVFDQEPVLTVFSSRERWSDGRRASEHAWGTCNTGGRSQPLSARTPFFDPCSKEKRISGIGSKPVFRFADAESGPGRPNPGFVPPWRTDRPASILVQ